MVGAAVTVEVAEAAVDCASAAVGAIGAGTVGSIGWGVAAGAPQAARININTQQSAIESTIRA